MSIKSHAFGRVTLTGEDAKKFKNQVTYGKPKKAAVESVKSGTELLRRYSESGRVSIALRHATGDHSDE